MTDDIITLHTAVSVTVETLPPCDITSVFDLLITSLVQSR